jgi:hypothetical protein
MTVSVKAPTSTTGSIQLNGSDVLTFDSSGNVTVPNNLSVIGTAPIPDALSTASGSAPSYSARAWVNFQGTSTVTIRASGNVSSITDEGVGQYLVNFTTSMADANYSVAGSCNYNNGTGMTDFTNGLVSTSACRVICHDVANTTQYDPYAMNVAVFR